MSFRARLNLFFLVLVVVPLVAVGFVLLRTLDNAARGRSESSLGAQARVVQTIAAESRRQADGVARSLASDRLLARALRSGDLAAIRKRAVRLLGDATGARRIRIVLSTGGTVDVGSRTAILPTVRELVGPDASATPLARLETSVTGPKAFAARLDRLLPGRRVLIREPGSGRILGGTGATPRAVPAPGTISDAPGGDDLAVTVRQLGFGGRPADVVVVDPGGNTRASSGDRIALVATLIAFLLLAAAGSLVVSRSLQRQVAVLLAGAKRLGRGEFDEQIPRQGEDEFAQLADAFNDMSAQLRRRLEELDDERARLRRAIRRIGESFASNLDREGLLETVVRAASDAVRGDAGRARLTVGETEEVVIVGELAGLTSVVQAAEAGIGSATGGDGLASEGELHALAVPMGGTTDPTGVVTVARRGAAFTADDAEIVAYLSGQVALSLENVVRHEAVEREAQTDALTGLANRRRFDGLLGSAVARARRDGRPLSLLLLDLDHFKRVNDDHGHPAGDAVLREIAWTLRDRVRGIDDAARVGGEEFAVILPDTDREGAVVLAERLREAVADTVVETPEGLTVRLTGSIGIGTLQGPTVRADELVSLADGALYRAKADGRNRTVTADEKGLQG